MKKFLLPALGLLCLSGAVTAQDSSQTTAPVPTSDPMPAPAQDTVSVRTSEPARASALTSAPDPVPASAPAPALEEDTKTRINRIKRDTAYLYGEATMPTREEAMTLAKDFLCSYIEQWIAETRDTQKIRSVVAKELISDCEELSLMRGSMYRAFAYVRKSDLYAVDTDAVSISVTKPAPAQPAVQDAATVADPAVSAARGVPATPAAPDGATAGAGQESAAVTQTVSAETPAPAPSFYDQLVTDLCGMQSQTEIERLMQSEAYASACTYGEVGYSTRPQDIEKGILVIYRPGNKEIAALLSPKAPKRSNLKTGKDDSTVNYPGCRAMWICIK